MCCFVGLRVGVVFCGGVAVVLFVCLLDCFLLCRFAISRVCLSCRVDGLLRCCYVVLCVVVLLFVVALLCCFGALLV